MTNDQIKRIYLESTGFDLDESDAALMDFARALLAHPDHSIDGGEKAPCVHADEPKACYRVRCQLGNKCVDDDMSFRHTAPVPQDGDERAAFEAWARDKGLSLTKKAGSDAYAFAAEKAWLAWRDRAALVSKAASAPWNGDERFKVLSAVIETERPGFGDSGLSQSEHEAVDVLHDFAQAALASNKAAAVAVDEPDNRPTSAIDAVADFLEESANLSIISQFTSIAEWIDARASAVLVDFDAWATTQKWADRYDMDVARIGWTAALASRPPAPIASASEAVPTAADILANQMQFGADMAAKYSRVCRELAALKAVKRALATYNSEYCLQRAAGVGGGEAELIAMTKVLSTHPAAAQPSIAKVPDAAIKSCALIIKGMCMTHPVYEWAELIEARIRFMLRDKP
jgi:hypothetical protein